MSEDPASKVPSDRPESLFRDGVEIRLRIFKDFWSATTHFAGFIAAVVGLVVLLLLSEPGAARLSSAAIYGGSLVALFAASSAYHFFDLGERGNRWLQRIDHIGIYLLIAGTQVPSLVLLLDGTWRVVMLSVVGGFAAAGVSLKLFWMDCPEWLSTALYLAFGWLGLVPLVLAFPQLDLLGIGLMVGGGLAYTVGALVFQREWPDPWPERFGHHEIWHLLVLGGAVLHFFFNVRLVV